MNDIGLKQLLSSCPKEKLSSFIKEVPDNAGAWLLQQTAAANEMTAAFVVTEALRDKRYSILKSFPLEIRISEASKEKLGSALNSSLSREELESAISQPGSITSSGQDRTEIETAREIFSMIPERLILPFLKELKAEMPDLYPEIRDYLFFFEDMALLDNISLRRLLRELDTRDLIKALIGAGDRVKSAFTRNMSKRAVEYLEEDLISCRDAKTESIDESRANIINILRRMEENGEIVICAADRCDAPADEEIEERPIVKDNKPTTDKGEETIMKDYNLNKDIDLIVDLHIKAKGEGLLAIESDLPNLPCTFLKIGLQLIVDGTDPILVRKVLENTIEAGDFSKSDRLRRKIFMEGVCGIQEGMPTRVLKALLCSFIGEEEAYKAITE